MGFLDTLGKIGLAPITGGMSLLSGGTGSKGLDSTLHKLPLIGGFIPDPAAEEKQRMLHQLAVAYQAQRPELAQTQTNALNQSLGAYKPSNDMIGQMYGQGAMADLNALGKNPMTPGMMKPAVGPLAGVQKEIDLPKGARRWQGNG